MPAPDVHDDFITSTMNNIFDPWIYAAVPNVTERGVGRMHTCRRCSKGKRNFRKSERQDKDKGTATVKRKARWVAR